MRHLSLVSSPAPAPSEPASPRERLADIQARLQEARTRSLQLHGDLVAPLDVALAEEREALEAVEAVAEHERLDWVLWSRTGLGRSPAPRQREREEARARLDAAHAKVMRARQLREASVPARDKVDAEVGELSQPIPDLIAAIVLDEAHALADRYRRAFDEATLAAAAMEGLLESMRRRNRMSDRATLLSLFSLGSPTERDKAIRHIKDRADGRRAAWFALADRLEDDANAVVSEDQ